MTTQAELPMIEEQMEPCLERPDSWSFLRLIRQAVQRSKDKDGYALLAHESIRVPDMISIDIILKR